MITLYKPRPIVGQSFKGAKRVVVPNQSMTLAQIIKRFIKHEPLPVMTEGTYNDQYDYDLEKLAHEDITVQEEVRDEMKQKAAKIRKNLDAQEKSAMEKARSAKAKEESELLAKWSEQQKDPGSSTAKQP